MSLVPVALAEAQRPATGEPEAVLPPAAVADVPVIESDAPVEAPADYPAGVAADGLATDADDVPVDPTVGGVELVSERKPDQQVFELPDGTLRVELHSEPVSFETAPGVWEDIDTGIVADEAAPGGFRSAANAWTARFAGDLAAGGLRVENAAGAVALTPRGAGPSLAEVVPDQPSSVRYAGVWSETDLEYTVHSTGVKEDIVVRSSGAPHRFEFSLYGATASADDEGGLVLAGPAGEFAVPAPSVADASGGSVTAASGVGYEVLDGGTGVAVRVDGSWLAGLPAAAFPLRVDPSIFVALNPFSSYSWPSTGGAAVNGVKVGRDNSGGAGVSWRSQVRFNLTDYLNHPYLLVGAGLHLVRPFSEQLVQPANRATLHAATEQTFAGTNGPPLSRLGLFSTDGTVSFVWNDEQGGGGFGLRPLVQHWMDTDTNYGPIGIVGAEATPGTLHNYSAELTLVLQPPTSPSTLTAPADRAVLATRTPTFAATTVPLVDGFWQPQYRFDVTIQGGGTAVSSGWFAKRPGDPTDWVPTWTVPEGSLRDGANYTVTVYTASDETARAGYQGMASLASIRRFRVDLGLGDGGPAPTETAGAVPGVTGSPSDGSPTPSTPATSFTINMIDGNLAASVPTHSVAAISASIAPALVYNSRADTLSGLVGRYYSDEDRDRVFDTTDVLRGQRTDPAVSFQWYGLGVSSMTGGMPPDAQALAQWTGYIKVPETGDWELGLELATGSSGGRIYLGTNQAPIPPTAVPIADDWQPYTTTGRTTRFSTSRTMTAGQWTSIRVEYWSDFVGEIKLVARRGTVVYEVPSSWLAKDAPALPQGWQLSTGAGPLGIVGIEDLGNLVLVRSADGSSVGYQGDGRGGYSPPFGGTDHLALDGDGRFVLSTAGGLQYRFGPEGQVDEVTTIVDDLHPAALEYDYDGSPLRLRSITDPVSARPVTFSYGGEGCTAPASMLCRITFWDGTTTELGYDAAERLVRVTNPGYATSGGGTQPTLFDFGYDTAGRLSQVRDPLAADAIAYGTRADNATARTRLGYDPTGRLVTITPPRPLADSPTATTTYVYGPEPERTTTVQVEGFAPASGFARRVRWNPEGRIIEDTDAAGLTTSFQWDDQGRVVAETAPDGLRMTHAYDSQGNRTHTWGPAPSNQFGPDNRPIAGASVPQQTASYDDGLSGLAATFWSNPNLAGPPDGHRSGMSLADTWASGPPVTPDLQGRWSMRLTGEIFLDRRAVVFWPVTASGWTRMWIDDRLVFDSNAIPRGGSFEDPDFDEGGGWYRVRIDYVHDSAGDVLGVRRGVESNNRAIRLDELRPAYGLPTRSTDADGKVTATEYSDPARHIGPEHGLATATVVDPDGLALRTTTRFEDPTQGGLLRRTDRALPAGGTTTTEYYGGSAGPIAAVCGLNASTPQGGFPRQVTQTDPDGTGPQRPVAEQFVYDTAGRAVGVRRGDTATVGSAGWACTSYDGRGRPTVRSWPAHGPVPARASVFSYAEGGDPLKTRVFEYAPGTPGVTTTMDLRGQLVTYESPGTTSLRLYDTLGRPTVTFDNGFWSLSAYDPATGRLSSMQVSDGGFLAPPPATHAFSAMPSYDAVTGRLTGVTYSNGSSSVLSYDSGGRPASVSYTGPGGTGIGLDALTRSPAGRVVDQVTLNATGFVDANPAGPNYGYDGAGRLTEWWDAGTKVTHGYGTATCGEAAAGKNTNLTSITRQGQAAETYCYDLADRIAPGGGVSSVSYDDWGSTIGLGDQTYVYDASNRHIGTRAGTATVDYVRDPLDRIVERREGSSTQKYLYSGFGDAPSALANAAGEVVERYVSLPGGVTVTFPAGPGTEIWAYPNLHGDIIATANQSGVRQGDPRTYDPYGRGSPPNTTAGNRDLGWVGSASRYTDHASGIQATIDMGARPYSPNLGRFLTTDPIEGGCANPYVYVHGDPINSRDLSGRETSLPLCKDVEVRDTQGLGQGVLSFDIGAGSDGLLYIMGIISPTITGIIMGHQWQWDLGDRQRVEMRETIHPIDASLRDAFELGPGPGGGDLQELRVRASFIYITPTGAGVGRADFDVTCLV
jgi:RHS repeat-associated protein